MTTRTSQVFRSRESGLLGNALGAVIILPFGGRLHFNGENPLGSEANLVTACEILPRARAFQSRCQHDRKRQALTLDVMLSVTA